MLLAIQKLIYILENGGSSRLLRYALLATLFFALIVFFDYKAYHNLSSPEAMDAAQVARNLATGNGFSTQVIRPLSLHLTESAASSSTAPSISENYPDLANAPVYPLLVAGLMKLNKSAMLGVLYGTTYKPDFWLCLLNQALLILASVMVFRLARRLFDNVVAWTSLFLLVGTQRLWNFSVSGLSTMLLLDIFLVMIFVLLAIEKRSQQETFPALKAAGWTALLGLVIALGTLTRYSFGWLFIPTVICLCVWLPANRRKLGFIVVSLVFLAALAPWLLRNYSLSKTFFGVAGYALFEGATSPAVDLQRSFDPEVYKISGNLILGKFLTNLSQVAREVWPRFGIVGAFFVVGILVPFQSVTLNRMRWFTLGVGAVLSLVQILGRTALSDYNQVINSENLLILLLPLVICFGASLFIILLERFKLRGIRLTLIGAFICLVSLPLLVAVLSKPTTTPLEAAMNPKVIQTLCEPMGNKQLLLSDVPWAVAWYGERQCALLPLDAKKSLEELEKRKTIRALYISPLLMNKQGLLTQATPGSWDQLVVDAFVSHEFPPQFPKMHRLERIPKDHMVLLSDAP